MKDLILIKLGGSLITDKSKAFTAREKVILSLAQELKSALGKTKKNILLGHGSGSFGHSVAARYQTQEGIVNKESIKGFPLVADAARKINEIVIDQFIKSGLPAVSFSPLSFIESKNQKVFKCFCEPIKRALEIGLVPVIYGDVILDREKRGFCIFSGEKTLNLLVANLKGLYKNISIIYCGETDGVYDAFGETIEKITPKTFKKYLSSIKGSENIDVTGGMLHKVEESLEMAKKDRIQTIIINGTKKGNLEKAILGNELKKTLISF